MSIWKSPVTIDEINSFCNSTMVSALGIKITEIGDDYLKGEMPFSDDIKQPMGIVHGGAYVTLAESLGSIAAMMAVDNNEKYAVGMDISANYIRSVREGMVYGIAKPVHIGNSSQVWDIELTDSAEKRVAVIRLTMANLKR